MARVASFVKAFALPPARLSPSTARDSVAKGFFIALKLTKGIYSAIMVGPSKNESTAYCSPEEYHRRRRPHRTDNIWIGPKQRALGSLDERQERMVKDRRGSDRARADGDADVIVLGVGTCGEDLSLRLLGAGLKVVGIEAALVGGECPYWACLPSKMMIRAAGALQEARRIDGLAGRAEVTPDWAPVAARVRTEATGDWDDSIAVKRFEERGGRLVHGYGKLTGPRSVAVEDRRIRARVGIVIATGSVPAIPLIPGLDTVDFWTTRDAIKVESLPKSMVVIGGGVAGCELGQVMARFGVQVDVVEAGPRLLPAEEPEASQAVEAAFAAENIGVYTNAPVERVESRNGSIAVWLPGGKVLEGERLLVATGRTVELKDLGLESAGLDSKARFIQVDEHMRAADGIWAMGDVTGKGMATHVALYQSAIVAAGILGEENHPPAQYDALPRATFTDPEVGGVGVTEAEALASERDVVVVVKRLPSTFRGWLHRSDGGFIKLIADRKSGVLVGATAVGPRGGEMLGFLTLAVHARVPLTDLRSMVYAFPTFFGGIGEALGAYGRGLATVLDPGYEGVGALGAAVETDSR
jgi:pyruvate/2-oxoglutarate dehydrogenase complex dihydrolipoamide dehydrogenase (E3) component